ncbi:hypothetical protein [Paenibacillus sp. FSL P4-0184]
MFEYQKPGDSESKAYGTIQFDATNTAYTYKEITVTTPAIVVVGLS